MRIRSHFERILRQFSYIKGKGFDLYVDDFINGKRMWRLQKSEFQSDRFKQSVSGSSGDYLSIVVSANSDNEIFKKFRSNLEYMTILEHVDRQLGSEYLKIIKAYESSNNSLIRYVQKDVCGPFRFSYPGIGRVSPTNLRYAKVCLDINALFGSTSTLKIAEIGIGYGGQCAALHSYNGFTNYTLYDLPPVLKLAQKYLAEMEVPRERIESGSLESNGHAFDLMISNYSFSELSRELQEEYLEKVVLKSKSGYVIYNDFSNGPLSPMSAHEFAKRVPNSVIVREFPTTHPNNCLVLWGDHDLDELLSGE